MGVDGFVCWTARSVDDPSELRRTLDVQLPDGDQALDEARSAGLLSRADLRPEGLVAAHAFAERSGLPMPGPTDAITDFRAVIEALDAAEREARKLTDDDVPDGFEAVRPTASRYDREYHTVNRARRYPSDAEVELNYRSRDPSHPGESKPNVSSAVAWLRGDAAGTHEYRVEWREA